MEYPLSQHPIRKSTRLPGYDYTQPGAYFVTICTRRREPLLGNLIEGEMLLNPNGKIVCSCWKVINNHFPRTELSEFVIMPNHLHGIILINNPVEARHAVPVPTHESFGKPLAGSLPTIIRSFKSAVTKQVNTTRGDGHVPFWHRGYYEHVIRSEKEFVQIGEYIQNNPMKWDVDRENPCCSEKVKPLPFEY